MDKMVLATQKYLNSMYGGNRGYNSIVEDGETGPLARTAFGWRHL